MRTFYLFFIAVVFISSCSPQQNKQKEVVNIQNKIERQKQFLYEKQIPSLTSILGDSIQIPNGVLLIYTNNDCDDCVRKGFDIVHTIDSLHICTTYVIASTFNPGRDQLLYNYTKYIYVDEHDLIRKDLKFIYTPVILKMDKNSKIQYLIFPGIASSKEEIDFLQIISNSYGSKENCSNRRNGSAHESSEGAKKGKGRIFQS